MTAIDRLDKALRTAGVPILGVSGSQGSIRVDYAAGATLPQRTQGESVVAAFDWSPAAHATASAKVAKTSATDSVNNGGAADADASRRITLAILGLLLDELNAHTSKINSILDAIDAATTLANLKTAIAAIPNYPTRTAQQVRDAVVSKINATAE